MINTTFNSIIKLNVDKLNIVDVSKIQPDTLHYDILIFINQLIYNKNDINSLGKYFNKILSHFKLVYLPHALELIKSKVKGTIELLEFHQTK